MMLLDKNNEVDSLNFWKLLSIYLVLNACEVCLVGVASGESAGMWMMTSRAPRLESLDTNKFRRM